MKYKYGFKIGDRVEFNGTIEGVTYKGKLGTVKCFHECFPYIEVKFDKNFLNDCRCYVFPTELKKVEEKKQTIVIKHDGDTVTAYMGKRQAVAKCSPKDEFDLYKGAILALTRLLIEEK